MHSMFGSVEDFYTMFLEYNLAVWPMPVVMYVLAVAILFLMMKKKSWSDTAVLFILSLYWLWAAVVFSLMYFSKFSPAFYGTGFLFAVQGVLFFLNGTGVGVKPRLSFQYRKDARGWMGILFILYAMIAYPLIGWATSHAYPAGPIFGTAPCPMSIYTVGMLLLTDKKIPILLLIIPCIWGINGIMPVLVYDVIADIGLVVSGIAALFLIVRKNV